MKTIEEILALSDADAMAYLKNRKTTLPDVTTLLSDWNPMMHDVHDPVKRKDAKVLTKEATKDKDGNVIEAKYDTEPVNRISLPIEQDIVNIHTAFTVGTPPKLECDPTNEQETEMLDIIKAIDKRNKIKYQNKAIVRSWLSEQEVAEYWFVVDDNSGFWNKLFAKIKSLVGLQDKPAKKLRSMVWSAFRGDTLYPLFDDFGDLIALSREYKTRDIEGKDLTNFMTVTATQVITWKQETNYQKKIVNHGFKKMPVIYAYRSESLTKNIKPMRHRLETLISDYADCIDRYFFPFMLLRGAVKGAPIKAGKSRMIKVEGQDANASYLEWSQSPESVKLEMDSLTEKMYSMTNTPRISFENLKGVNAQSGVAFRYTFMGAHLAVENHAETIGEFFQRRYNFLVSAIATMAPKFEDASQTIDINVEIVPYMIDSVADKIKTAVEGVSGKVMSRKQGIAFVGIADSIEDTLKEMDEDNAASLQEPTL